MPTAWKRRTARAAGHALSGVALLAALVWLTDRGLERLAAHEQALDDFWGALYLGLGRATAWLLAGIALAAVLHLWRCGRQDVRPRGPHDALRWWSAPERSLHWCMVAAFALLLVTGLELYAAGPGLPSDLTRGMRRWHFGEAFMVCGALLVLRWHREALPRRYDLRWLAGLGGYFRRGEDLPAARFNAGQKLWFWAELLLGVAMAVTGYRLQSSYTPLDPGYATLLVVHLLAAMGFLAVLAVHVYLATVGVRGALGGMIHGRIGRQGAQRLHPLAEALKAPQERP
jgi:formate dehydrogenase subunit gamma